MIDARLIAILQAQMSLYFTDARNVKGTRGSPGAFGTVYTAMPCRIVPISLQNTSGELLMQNTTFYLEYPATYTLMRTDKIQHATLVDEYEVIDLLDDTTPLIGRKALLQRVKQ